VYVAQKDVAAADFPSKPRRQLSWLQTIIVVATLDVVDDVVGFDEVVDVVVGFDVVVVLVVVVGHEAVTVNREAPVSVLSEVCVDTMVVS
jgi:Na+(H+)/acetate symporter ActP